jgi:hypothetical protein
MPAALSGIGKNPTIERSLFWQKDWKFTNAMRVAQQFWAKPNQADFESHRSAR